MSLLLLLSLVLAQQEPPPIKVEVNLVNVSFTVRRTDGQLARNLKAEDFEVLEDGVPQEIKFFGRSTDLPLRLALVIDGSNSQSKFNRDHHKDVDEFLQASLTSRDQALLLGFGNHLRVACGFTSNVEELMAGLTRYEKSNGGMPELDPDATRSGGTAMFDAVYAVANQKLQGVSGERKAMVLFSDGEDNASAHDVVEAIEAAQSVDALIYTVRYTEASRKLTARNKYGRKEMNRLAEETGGAAFDASQGHVAESLAAIGDELRSLYDIGYTTTNAARDGTFRKILIRVKKPGLTVRAKSGYYPK